VKCTVVVKKHGRNVKYKLHSYFHKNRLYTEIESWYRSDFPITSTITHFSCKTSKEANAWVIYTFTNYSATTALPLTLGRWKSARAFRPSRFRRGLLP
jgi:hypothetical protein